MASTRSRPITVSVSSPTLVSCPRTRCCGDDGSIYN
jgi:hypothetical protein